jgi:hypothetical protein
LILRHTRAGALAMLALQAERLGEEVARGASTDRAFRLACQNAAEAFLAALQRRRNGNRRGRRSRPS